MFADLELIALFPVVLVLSLLQLVFNGIGLGGVYYSILGWISAISPIL